MSLPETYEKLVAVHAGDSLRTSAEVQTVALEPPAAGHVLVKTHYAGVNAADYLVALGRYIAPTKYPQDMGAELVGEVVATGDGVDSLSVGQHVMVLMGGYRDYVSVPARFAIPIEQASAAIAACGVSGLTASIALKLTGEMTENETVLVTAAAGGTGSFAVQLAKIAGNTVIGTCGNDEKAAYLKQLGCDRPINYRQENVKDVLKAEFPKGVDIVFECVGGELYDVALNALAVHGRLIAIGAISEYESGPQMVTRPRDIYTLIGKSASIRGFWLMHYLDQIVPHMQTLIHLMDTGQLQVATDAHDFQGAAGALDALEYLYTGKNTGKVVVRFV